MLLRMPTGINIAKAIFGLVAIMPNSLVMAASSKFCDGGSFTALGHTGTADRFRGDVPTPSSRFVVQGQYTQFTVDPVTFAIYDFAWTGKANAGDMTSGQFTPAYASKVPDHRGLSLTSTISLELRDENIKLIRTGPDGLSMTLTAKDCAQGGIFQMEPERGDGTRTRVVHTLASGIFHYDNPVFRANLGKFLGSNCTSEATGPANDACIRVTPRVNMGSESRPSLVFRDSAQVATRVAQPACGPDFTNALGLTETKDYCGGMAIWDIASGGRLGMVTGEDAIEVANPPSNCVGDCQAQDNVGGKLATLSFPFPVPDTSRLTPLISTDGLDAPLTPPPTV